MAENEKSFEDKLVNMANVVDIIEKTFLTQITEINITLAQKEYSEVCEFLKINKEDNCKISIGSINITFLKM